MANRIKGITVEFGGDTTKLIGGILLFSKALEENADNIYVGADNLLVAYASNNVNSTSNLARGSLNLLESKALENGISLSGNLRLVRVMGRLLLWRLPGCWTAEWIWEPCGGWQRIFTFEGGGY